MKIIVVITMVVLAGLMLYPVLLTVGQEINTRLTKFHRELESTRTKDTTDAE